RQKPSLVVVNHRTSLVRFRPPIVAAYTPSARLRPDWGAIRSSPLHGNREPFSGANGGSTVAPARHPEEVENKEDDAEGDGRVGEVEDVERVRAVVEMEEIGHGAVNPAVERIGDRAA